MNRVGLGLHLLAVAVLAAVPFVPYLAVGRQNYAAIGFIERVGVLSSTSMIDANWRIPPAIGLAASVLGVLSLVAPARLRTAALLFAATVAMVGAVLSFRLANGSVLLDTRIGSTLLLVAAAVAFVAAGWNRMVP